MNASYVSPRAKISDSAYIGDGVKIYGPAKVSENCVIEDNVAIGKPDRDSIESLRDEQNVDIEHYDAAVTRETTIGANTVLRTGSEVYEGCELGESVGTENYVRIGWDSSIGSQSRIMYRGLIYVNVSVGRDTWVGGFVSNNTQIGNDCSFFGSAIHEFPPEVEDPEEDNPEHLPAPQIKSGSIVGFGAQLIGGIDVGEGSYVGSNAVITKDVPADYMAINCNELRPKENMGSR